MRKDSQPTNMVYLMLMFVAAVLFLIIGLLLGGLYLLFQVAAVTWPVWGGAVMLILLVSCLLYALRIRHLERNGLLGAVVSMDYRVDKLEFRTLEYEMERLAQKGSAVFMSVLCALLWCSALIYVLYHEGAFSNITWWFYSETMIVSPLVSVIVSSCIGCASIILTFIVAKPERIFRCILIQITGRKLKRINNSIKGLNELVSLDTFFDTIGEPLNLRADIEYHVDVRKEKLLSLSPVAIDRMNSLIAERIRMAKRRKEMYAPTDEERSRYVASASRMTVGEARDILQVGEDATCEEIKHAYWLEVKKWNVDQRQHLEPHIKKAIEEQFKKVNTAYEVLM